MSQRYFVGDYEYFSGIGSILMRDANLIILWPLSFTNATESLPVRQWSNIYVLLFVIGTLFALKAVTRSERTARYLRGTKQKIQ